MNTPGPSPLRRLSVPGDSAAIGIIADNHKWSRHSADAHADRIVAWTAKHCHAVIGGGDYVEAIPPSDKRWDPSCVRLGADPADLIPEQFRDAREMLRPLDGRWLCFLKGNHEDRWIRQVGAASTFGALAREVGADAVGYSALFRVALWFNDPGGRKKRAGRPPSRIVEIAAHHGSGGGRTAGSKLGRPIDWTAGLQRPNIVVQCHTHALGSWHECRLGLSDDERSLVDHPIAIVLAGTTARSYTAGEAGYAERAQYRPVPMGRAVIRVYQDETGIETIA